MNYYYLLGLYVGDGSQVLQRVNKNGTRKYLIDIIMSDRSFMELKDIIPYGSIKTRKSKDGYSYHEIWSVDDEFCKELRESCGMTAKDKKFPENMTEEQFWEFASGLIDSDGTVTVDYISFENTNLNLINEFCEYLDKYSIEYAKIEAKQKYDRWKNKWIVRIRPWDLKKTKFNLRVDYKRDRLELLKNKAKEKKYKVTREFIERNWKIIIQYETENCIRDLRSGKKNTLKESTYVHCTK